jgi:hypothetical protein
MRLRFTLDIRLERSPKPIAPEEPQHEHRDNDGTMVIHQDQPRFIGFRPQPEPTDE